jgi:predicted nucleic acid-binding protein
MTMRSGSFVVQTSDSAAQEVLLDTSAAVALMVSDHDAHSRTIGAVRGWQLGLAGHAWFETYSVLTRLPGRARRDGREIHGSLVRNFPASRFLDERSTWRLVEDLTRHQIAGGAVYDALVAAVARDHRLPLVTRDSRAVAIYDAFDVDLVFVE